MKSKVKYFIYLLLAAGFAACAQKEEPFNEPEEVVLPQEEAEGDFAYIFKVGEPETKTTFETNHVAWNADDLVASYAKTSKNKSTPVAIDGSGIPHITIRSSVALSAGDMVYAYYPYSSANDSKDASEVTLEIPRNQVSGSADAMPMVALPFELTGDVASYTNTEVGTLQFLNLGSIIKLNIFSSNASFQGETVENVTFQAGAACAGSFTYDLTSVNASSPAAISGYSETDVVVFGDGANPTTVGADKDHGGVFYIIVAPGTYTGSFKIRTSRAEYVYNSTSRTYSRAGMKPLNIDLASTNWTVVTGYDNTIDSPREFAAFLAGTTSSDTGSYTITVDLDMTGYTITSASGFGGTLNGNDHVISNITSSVPLFAEISGSVSNLTLEGIFTPAQTVTEFGALAAVDNGGTYNNVNNAASITITATSNITNNIAIGGLIGASNNNDGSTFTSCSNSGAITINAAGRSHWAVAMGGIVGWAKRPTFNYCTNSGALSLSALYGDPFHNWPYVSGATTDPDGNICMGGIVGKIWDLKQDKATYKGTFDNCENKAEGTITLTHTQIDQLANNEADYGCLNVGGVCGQGNGSMEYCQNNAPISATAIGTNTNDWWTRQNCILHVGGIVGKSNRGISINSCSNKEGASINVNYDGSWNKTTNVMSSVGGIIGGETDDSYDAKIFYSSNRGPITVTGLGSINVGGICGAEGYQRGNKVYETAVISVNVRESYVGGLLGYADGSAQYQSIKTSFCEANITAENSYPKEGGSESKLSVGGLIGCCNTGATGSYPSLVPSGSDTYRCHYSGNIVATSQSRVGMVIGRVMNNNTKVFGEDGTPIQVTGTIYRMGMTEPVTINASNIENYAIGTISAGTVTIYVESPTPTPLPAANLTLMSFNIREGSNWSSRKSPIVSMINGESPDIIGLQEVKDLDMWDHMTEDHPWDYLTDKLTAYSGYRYSDKTNAILYKKSTVEMSNFGYFWLRDSYNSEGNSWDGYERTVLYATVKEKATGRYFFYLNTHFPMNNNNGGWAKCTALLESRIAALNTNNYPVILMGDFNCVIGDSCWDSIKTWMKNTRYSADTIVSTENKDLYTYNAFGDTSKDRNKVDHIWVSKTGINVDTYTTLTSAVRSYGGYTTNGETFLSDHYPIIAHIS